MYIHRLADMNSKHNGSMLCLQRKHMAPLVAFVYVFAALDLDRCLSEIQMMPAIIQATVQRFRSQYQRMQQSEKTRCTSKFCIDIGLQTVSEKISQMERFMLVLECVLYFAIPQTTGCTSSVFMLLVLENIFKSKMDTLQYRPALIHNQ